MTVKHAGKRVARALQQVALDETGKEPKYTLCLKIVEESGGRDASVTVEEQACKLFEIHRERLR